MKKRIILLLICVLTLAVSLCLFTACDDDGTSDKGGTTDGGNSGTPCTHNYQGTVTKEAGCETTGTLTYTCSLCQNSYTEPIPAKGHSHSTELSGDATHHYYLCACGDKKDKAAHVSSGPATATEDEYCTVCDYVITPAVGISFKTLTVTGNTVYGKVSNNTEYFSFINEVTSTGGAKYIVSTNIDGTGEHPSKTINLEIGDNTVYITEKIDDEPIAVYIVTVRRRPIYEVAFDTNGGSAVPTQYIEEDGLATEPTSTRAGYTFASWSYDFNTPITRNTKITAKWSANDDTPYKVEYYLQNLDQNGYELIEDETENSTGQTDTMASAEWKKFDHFTLDHSMSTLRGKIDGEGNLVLKVYYTRRTYTLSNSNTNHGTITKAGSYKYGSSITSIATAYLGCEFIGWYSGDKCVSTETTYVFTAESNVKAVFEVKEEMKNFQFTSTATTCIIEKCYYGTVIVVPDYVTTIMVGAFKNCTALTSITIPFVGTSRTTSGETAHFGAIFGWEIIPMIGTWTGDNRYYIPKSLRTVIITGGTYIQSYALANLWGECDSITSITIPKSVIHIEESAISGLKNLSQIYYCGTAAEWEMISIESGNQCLLEATRHYNA